MIDKFVDFCTEIFPSISPYKVNNLKKALDQFNREGQTFDFCCSTSLEYLAQGDIFSDLPFIVLDENNQYNVVYRKGMLLSNTCDASRNDTLIFAALQSITDFEKSQQTMDDIKNNRVTQFMYIPCSHIENEVIDFGLINTFPRKFINDAYSLNKINKICSLNDYGFYILLSKITIFFCRRQDAETESDRRKELLT